MKPPRSITGRLVFRNDVSSVLKGEAEGSSGFSTPQSLAPLDLWRCSFGPRLEESDASEANGDRALSAGVDFNVHPNFLGDKKQKSVSCFILKAFQKQRRLVFVHDVTVCNVTPSEISSEIKITVLQLHLSLT